MNDSTIDFILYKVPTYAYAAAILLVTSWAAWLFGVAQQRAAEDRFARFLADHPGWDPRAPRGRT